MKYVSILLIAVISSAKEVPYEIRKQWDTDTKYYRSICISESGVDPVLAHRIFLYQEFVDNPCLNCYLYCISKHMGMLNLLDESLPHIWYQQTANVTFEIAIDCVNKTNVEPDPCKKLRLLGLCFCDHLGV